MYEYDTNNSVTLVADKMLVFIGLKVNCFLDV